MKLQAENYQAMNKQYPEGTVRSILKTDEVTTATRTVLNERLVIEETQQPLFFNKESFVLLHAVCDCLIPQKENRIKIDLAGNLDKALNKNEGSGWRYDKLPPFDRVFRDGMNGIQETSILLFHTSFNQLDKVQQKQVLTSIQKKTALGKTWQTLPSNLFFEELLTRITELYYSHPIALEEIGVVAMADAKGWTKIGLNNLEDREPKLINDYN